MCAQEVTGGIETPRHLEFSGDSNKYGTAFKFFEFCLEVADFYNHHKEGKVETAICGVFSV